jgi:hypothetical protein
MQHDSRRKLSRTVIHRADDLATFCPERAQTTWPSLPRLSLPFVTKPSSTNGGFFSALVPPRDDQDGDGAESMREVVPVLRGLCDLVRLGRTRKNPATRVVRGGVPGRSRERGG